MIKVAVTLRVTKCDLHKVQASTNRKQSSRGIAVHHSESDAYFVLNQTPRVDAQRLAEN